MAQVTFVGAGAGAGVAGIGNLNIPYPTGILASDLLVLTLFLRSNDALGITTSTPGFGTSISYTQGYPGFSTNVQFLERIAVGNETGNLVVTFTGDTASKLKFGRMYAFRNNRTALYQGSYPRFLYSEYWQFTTTPPPQPLAGLKSDTTNTPIFGDVWSPENDALGVCICNVWDDNPQTAPTNATGGTYTEPIAEFTSTVGTDGSIGIFTVPLTANQLVTGGSFSMGGGAADPWGTSTFTILAASPGVSYTPVDPMGQRGFFGL